MIEKTLSILEDFLEDDIFIHIHFNDFSNYVYIDFFYSRESDFTKDVFYFIFLKFKTLDYGYHFHMIYETHLCCSLAFKKQQYLKFKLNIWDCIEQEVYYIIDLKTTLKQALQLRVKYL